MSVELSDLLSGKKKDVKNPHNDGLVSASLKEFIEKTQKLGETSSIIRDILKNPKQFTINQLLRAIEEVENQGSYSAEVDYQRTIEEIKSIVYDNLSDYKICYERYFRKISTRLAKHLDYFKKGPVIIGFGKKEIRCSEPIGESNPWLVLGTNYPFVDYTPNCGQEFFCISTSPDEIKARQKVIGELQKIVDKDVLKFLDIFGFIDEINFNKLLYSRTYERDYSDDDYNGYLLAAYYGPGLYTEQQESDEYRPRESVSYKEKGTYNYYEEVANYIMSILDKIGQVPGKLRIIIEKLKDIPSLQDYILDLESALSESEYFFSLESFTAGNPFFDALKFVNEKKRKKESEIDKSKGARIDKMLALVDVNDNGIDDKGFINNGESEFVLAERYNAHLKIIEKLLEKLQKIKNLINIAYHVKSNEWNQVSLNNEEKTEYRDGWHPGRQIGINSIGKEGEVYFHPIDRNQVVNDSPADASLIIYSGANTSGKTFSGLQRDFFIRIAMQSFGYAPVETGNIAELYDMIVYFDRASTNSKDKKSAYMSEISRLKNLFEACQGKSMLLYYDEPFSTTSPIDQSAMIESLVAYIHARGGKCIIATHNEVFIKSQKSNPNTKCYFFPIVDGKCTRILTPGVGASDFIDVAKREGFNLDTINNAEAYLDGSLTILKTIHPNIDLSVGVGNSAKSLFPDLSEGSNPIFGFLSDDSDFDFAKGVGKFRFDDAFSNLDRVIIQRMLAKMIYYAPELTIQAIKERQNLFLELLQNSNYQEIAKLCSYLVEVEENFMSLEGVGINQKLCPIQIGESRIEYQIVDMLDLDKYDGDCNSITKMIRYLGFNRIIFGKLSKEADGLKKKLITFRKKLKLFQDSIDNQRKDYFTRKKENNSIDVEKTYYSMSSFLSEIFGISDGSNKSNDEFFRSIFSSAQKGLFLENELSFDSNTLYLIQELYKILSNNTESIDTKEMIDFIKKFLSNILSECSNIPVFLEELKLNNQELFNKSVFLRLFDPAQPFANDRMSDGDETDKFKVMKNRSYRVRRVNNISGILSKFGTKGSIANVLLILIQAKKDFEELKKKLLALNNPITNEIVGDLVGSFDKMWNGEGVDRINLEEEEVKLTGRNNLGRGTEGEKFIGKDTLNYHLFGDLGSENKTKRGVFTTLAYQLASLCAFSTNIKQLGLDPATFSDTGEFAWDNAGNPFENGRPDDKNGIALDKNQTAMILTGPNGSGKTYYGKTVIMNTLLALSTGWTNATNSLIPKFEKVIFLDRVVEVGNERSSGAVEIDYWTEVLNTLEKSTGPVLLVADEIFSSTSPTYQGAFMASVLKKLIEKGAYLIISNHHREVTDWLIKKAPNKILAYHFGFTITPEETIEYHRVLSPGIRDSHAREAANTMGFSLSI